MSQPNGEVNNPPVSAPPVEQPPATQPPAQQPAPQRPPVVVNQPGPDYGAQFAQMGNELSALPERIVAALREGTPLPASMVHGGQSNQNGGTGQPVVPQNQGTPATPPQSTPATPPKTGNAFTNFWFGKRGQ